MARARTDGAVEVRRLRMDEPLRPQGTVAPVFVPGAHKKPSTALADLARLIGNFKGYVDTQDAERKKKQEDDLRAQQLAQWNSLSQSEQWEASRNGQVGAEGSPYEYVPKATAGASMGQFSAAEWMAGMEEDIAQNYNPEEHGSKAAYVEARRRERMASLPDDYSKNAFWKLTQEYTLGAVKVDADNAELDGRLKRTNELATSLDGFRLAGEAGGRKVNPTELVKAWNEDINAKLTAGTLRREDVVPALVTLATEAAKRGDTALVQEIFNHERVGPDGTKIKLSEQAAFRVKAPNGQESVKDLRATYEQLTQASENERLKIDTTVELKREQKWNDMEARGESFTDIFQWYEDNPEEDPSGSLRQDISKRHMRSEVNRQKLLAEQAANAQYQAASDRLDATMMDLLEKSEVTAIETSNNGDLPELPSDKADGAPKKVTKADLEVRYVQLARALADRKAEENGWDDTQKNQYYISVIAKNGIVDKSISNATTNLGRRAATWKEGKDAASDIARAEQLWEVLRLHPNASSDYLGEDKMNTIFYHSYVTARRDMGASPADAYDMAARNVQRYDKDGENLVTLTPAEVSEMLNAPAGKEYVDGKGMGWLTSGDADPTLTAQNVGRITRVAEQYLRLGIAENKQQALDMATQQFASTHTNINGALVAVGAAETPQQFRETATRMLTAIHEERVKSNMVDPEASSPEDYTLISMAGGGRYLVVDKKTGFPLLNDDGTRKMLTIGEIKKDGQEFRRIKAEEMRNEIIRADFDKRYGLSWAEEFGFELNTTGGLNTRKDLTRTPEGIPAAVAMDKDFVTGTNWLEANLKLPEGSLWDVMDVGADGPVVAIKPEDLKSMGYTQKQYNAMSRIEQVKVAGKLLKSKLPEKPTAEDVKKVFPSDKTKRKGQVSFLGKEGLPRGIRNNNPGNIEFGKFTKTRGAIGSDGRFAKFASAEEGIAAMYDLLKLYQSKHGRTNVQSMIARWAPPGENNTKAYARVVAKAMGIDPSTDFDIRTNKQLAAKMLAAMIKHENGKQVYDFNTFVRAVSS